MADGKVRVQIGDRVLALSNLDKPLFASGFTKGEMIAYYAAIAPVMLDHLSGRCVTRVRFPEGTARAGFFEKNAPAGAPEWLRVVTVRAVSGTVDYPVVDDAAGLVWLANLAAVELHTPQWRVAPDAESVIVDDSAEPDADCLMIDLDPGEGVTLETSALASLIVAAKLTDLGLDPFVKTSGNKGLQVVAPIVPMPASQVSAFTQALAQHLTRVHPTMFVPTVAVAARKGRVFVDWAQNAAARNTICAYSLRGLDSPRVSTPLSWAEIEASAGGEPLAFGPDDVLARVADHGDLWAGLNAAHAGRALPAAGTLD